MAIKIIEIEICDSLDNLNSSISSFTRSNKINEFDIVSIQLQHTDLGYSAFISYHKANTRKYNHAKKETEHRKIS